MDSKKPDLQKRSLSQLEDSSFSCPDCKDLDEHRSKNCYKELTYKNSRDSMNVHTDKEEAKSLRFRCDDCFLSFTGSQSLEEYLQKNRFEMADIEISLIRDSYESSIDVLIEVMFDEKNNIDLLKKAKDQAHGSLRRYKDVKNRKDTAKQAYQEAVTRERKLGTVVSGEEQKILSHIVSETFRELDNAANALELEGTLLYQAVRQVRHCNRALMYTAIQVHYALYQAMQALNEWRLSIISDFSSLETEEQELKRLQGISKERHAILDQLQDEVADLNACVASMMGIEPNEEHPTTTQNKDGGRGTMQENLVVGDAQVSRIETNAGIHDVQRPSTSGTSSGYVFDAACETPDNVLI